jgi:acetyl-CoA C-acetyltransferase
MTDDPIVIAGFARTPMGNFQGSLARLTAPELGAAAIRAALERAGVPAGDVDEVFMGCVLPAGLGQAPARQAAFAAELPESAGCTTVNKVCGSGMKSAMLARDGLRLGQGRIMVAGGMESMTNAPYMLPKARAGMRMGHGRVEDHMLLDGLEDAYRERGSHMGTFAEKCAAKYGFTREDEDAFAVESAARARKAAQNGAFDAEITPVRVKTRKGEVTVASDDGPQTTKPENIPKLKPAFQTDGTVTAANSSSISDGGAALVLMPRSEAERRGITPLATIRGQATHSQAPEWFTTAPVGAIRKLLDRVGWTTDQVGLYEINEAFAVVTMAAMHDLNLAHERVDVHGGACVLGHPIGCSGARIIVTLLAAMQRYDVARGVASLCIGGGEATAVALERSA